LIRGLVACSQPLKVGYKCKLTINIIAAGVEGRRLNMPKTLPKLSPAFVTRNGKTEAVIISVKQYKAIKELLEDLEDHIDFEKGKSEPERDFSEFIKELKLSKVIKKCTKSK